MVVIVTGGDFMKKLYMGKIVVVLMLLMFITTACISNETVSVYNATELDSIKHTSAAETTDVSKSIETSTTELTSSVMQVTTDTIIQDDMVVTEQMLLETKDFLASDTYVKVLGRSLFKDNTRLFTYTCSGVEFEFMGTYASIDMICAGNVRVGVYVNDVLTQDCILEQGVQTLEVFSVEEIQSCKVTLRKLSEMGYNYVGVKNITATVYGEIQPSAEKEHRIEFVGDSVTCGYGIDNANFGNGAKSYAALVAERFDAEYSICACGGIGVYSAYTTSSSPNRTSLIENLYNTQAIDKELWDFSQSADLIVINLGSNDTVWVKDFEDRKQKFGTAYYQFLEQVYEHNPNVPIVCTYGMLNTGLMDEIRKQVSLFAKVYKDVEITCFEFELQDIVRDGYGTNYHPSEKTHELMANALTEYIVEWMNWERKL